MCILTNHITINQNKTKCKQIHSFTDWLHENQLPVELKLLEDKEMAELLRKLYGTVLSMKGNPYSHSGMINLQAGLNRHIQSPPYNCTCNLMNNVIFLPANKVVSGRMHNKEEKGL